jgi:hypothetical protein
MPDAIGNVVAHPPRARGLSHAKEIIKVHGARSMMPSLSSPPVAPFAAYLTGVSLPSEAAGPPGLTCEGPGSWPFTLTFCGLECNSTSRLRSIPGERRRGRGAPRDRIGLGLCPYKGIFVPRARSPETMMASKIHDGRPPDDTCPRKRPQHTALTGVAAGRARAHSVPHPT